jgi:hypothetical protein
MSKLRLAICLALFVSPFLIHQASLAMVACPEEIETTIPCPDTFPSCANVNPCTGNGSVVNNDNWGTDDSDNNARTRTAPSGNSAVCYTVYTCAVNLAGACAPNTNVQGQDFSKSTLTNVNCK